MLQNSSAIDNTNNNNNNNTNNDDKNNSNDNNNTTTTPNNNNNNTTNNNSTIINNHKTNDATQIKHRDKEKGSNKEEDEQSGCSGSDNKQEYNRGGREGEEEEIKDTTKCLDTAECSSTNQHGDNSPTNRCGDDSENTTTIQQHGGDSSDGCLTTQCGDDSGLYDCDFLRINVCGMIYETLEETLQRFPDTLLGDQQKRQEFFVRSRNAYFFDRNRASFEAILR